MKQQVNLLKIPPSRGSRNAPGWKKMLVFSAVVFAGSLLFLRQNFSIIVYFVHFSRVLAMHSCAYVAHL